MSDIRTVKLAEIRENAVALRAVNHESEEYLGLVDSMRQRGFLGAIITRERVDSETGKKYLELVDGLHRFAAAKDAGLETINVDVTDLNDDQMLEAQILANIHHIETKPIEYTRQLLRILVRNPLLTAAELSTRLGKSSTWVGQRLSLTQISDPTICSLINEGKISLTNAYSLAKLPPEEQPDFVDRAMTEAPEVFVPATQARIKEIREAHRKGKDATEAAFAPIAHMQKMKDVKAAIEDGKITTALLNKHKISTAPEAANMMLKWILHLDPESVASQQSVWEEKKRMRNEKKKEADAKRAILRAEKKKQEAEEAAKAAAEIIGQGQG